MQYRDYFEEFLGHGALAEVTPFAEVVEGGARYPLLRACIPGARTLLITAGFHGDETAGPLTLLTHFAQIAAYARARGIGLQIYPCLNPSGFEDGTRYNRSEEWPNNDFLRYEITAGVLAGELAPGQSYERHHVFQGGPKETRALRADLERTETPGAALDIHQDPWLGGAFTYAYTFGDNGRFLPLVEESRRHMPIAADLPVDENVSTDRDGLIVLHDGSVTDYFHRRGVGLTAALETTTTAPMDECHAVNLIWIKGFIDRLAAS